MSSVETSTPLMKQYWDLKAQAGDALLLFRMGDFYELFGDDAVAAAGILEITLTSRDKNKPNPLPMAGVPFHSVASYLARLLKAGRKVAIAEQVGEAPTGPKAIVRRELTRIFSPAIQFDGEGSEASYMGIALPADARAGDARHVLVLLDPATGDTRVSSPLDAEALAEEIRAFPVRHWLSLGEPGALRDRLPAELAARGGLFEKLPPNYLSLEQARECLRRQYGVGALDAFVASDAAAHALGILATYVCRSQNQERLAHLRPPVDLRRPQRLVLGPRAESHLDLVPSADGGPNLFQLVNRTRSALGARALRRWLLEPLLDPIEIAARQRAVRELGDQPARLEALTAAFAELYDLERISGRVNAGLANPRDTLALGRSLALLPRLAAALDRAEAPVLAQARAALTDLDIRLRELAARILRTQREDAPLVARDGGIFARGASDELDRLLSLTEDGQKWLVELERREREATGIPSLKVRYNRVFGYYIEVTQAHLKSVPAHYQRKQTTVGAERFFTEELKRFEDDFVHASSRQKALEQALFDELVTAIRAATPAITEASRVLGELDAATALGRLAQEPGWCFPVIDEGLDLAIEAGRHPLVDQAARGAFVPNDLRLEADTRTTLLITGPSMGGKSTVMRQVALIVVLGQMGAPVPARAARWGTVSSLHTRIGAHDAIARGQSTFMVEMSELAHIRTMPMRDP